MKQLAVASLDAHGRSASAAASLIDFGPKSTLDGGMLLESKRSHSEDLRQPLNLCLPWPLLLIRGHKKAR